MSTDSALSKEEAQLYDRQLRLWGVQSQQRLQVSKVALVGINAAQSEIAKNIILAGLNELTIYDWVKVEAHHTVPHLFLDPNASIGQNRATASKERLSELNPLVRVKVVEVASIEAAAEHIKSEQLDLVIAADMSVPHMILLNDVCRQSQPPQSHLLTSLEHPDIKRSLPFIGVFSFGLFGAIFLDLGNHLHTKETPNKDGTKTLSTALQVHNSLQSALEHDANATKPDYLFWSLLTLYRTEKMLSTRVSEASLELLKAERKKLIAEFNIQENKFPEDILETMARCSQYECAPVSAIIGGLVGQEAIKTLSSSSPPPLNNMFFYDALTSTSSVLHANSSN